MSTSATYIYIFVILSKMSRHLKSVCNICCCADDIGRVHNNYYKKAAEIWRLLLIMEDRKTYASDMRWLVKQVYEPRGVPEAVIRRYIIFIRRHGRFLPGNLRSYYFDEKMVRRSRYIENGHCE